MASIATSMINERTLNHWRVLHYRWLVPGDHSTGCMAGREGSTLWWFGRV